MLSYLPTTILVDHLPIRYSMETPSIKFEMSPADSLMESFDGSDAGNFGSLFEGMEFPERTLNPSELDGSEYSYEAGQMMTPFEGTPQPSSQQDKKVVKKRKSWGQQLPEPKTNLPPRKRAKTDDEKEQRRVERVLRNRRAAQTSRERKRMEVEALEAEKMAIERKNKDLEMRLAEAEARNVALEQRLLALSNASTPYSDKSSPQAATTHSPPRQMTFSQPLFASNDSQLFTSNDSQLFSSNDSQPLFTSSNNLQTIDPSSLSPEIRPVDASNASLADMTQHSAAVLWDLQCQSAKQWPWTQRLSVVLAMTLLAASSSILTPLAQIRASLTNRSRRLPTTWAIRWLIWALTRPPTTTAAASTSTTTTTASADSTSTAATPRQRCSTTPRFRVRMEMLRRVLACSPHLARPLMDATMSAMRLASEQLSTSESRDASATENVDPWTRLVAESIPLETLMTLLWATRVIHRKQLKEAADRMREEISHEKTVPIQDWESRGCCLT